MKLKLENFLSFSTRIVGKIHYLNKNYKGSCEQTLQRKPLQKPNKDQDESFDRTAEKEQGSGKNELRKVRV